MPEVGRVMKKAKTYGTPAAAELIGVHYLTLHRWLQAGKVDARAIELADGRKLWQWTDDDIEKAKAFKAGQKLGRPPKPKAKK
jgi:predicted site-specific integrase-resolvase